MIKNIFILLSRCFLCWRNDAGCGQGFIFFCKLIYCWLTLITCCFVAGCHPVPAWKRAPLMQSHLQLARQNIINKQWPLASRQLKLAASVSADYKSNPIYWTYRSQVCFAQNHIDASLFAAKRAWQLQSDSFMAMNNYAVLLCLSANANNPQKFPSRRYRSDSVNLHLARSLLTNLLRRSDLTAAWRKHILSNLHRCRSP